MKKMKDYERVRRMHLDEGMSIREIHRRTGFHRKTIGKMIAQGRPAGYVRTKVHRPVLEAFEPIIDHILNDDTKMPPKQRHTAKRIWERLREEHNYKGGYTQVRRYVRDARLHLREIHVPLQFEPGTAQMDWGEAKVRYGDDLHKVQLFVMTLPVSGARFVTAFPRATQEFFFEGHQRAFEFFGGVPSRIIYDNLKSAVQKVLKGRKRELNETFEQFSDHYLFEPAFCNVARGNEKGHVEGGVKWAQRRLMTPLPTFVDWRSLNRRLGVQCTQALEKPRKPEGPSVRQCLEDERASLRPIPTLPPMQGEPRLTRSDSLCLVRFDTNAYSVPCVFAHHEVTVRADVCEVRIFHRDRCIARHERCHLRHQAVYEPRHYLPLVERKPRTLDDGAPMKRLDLPECFDTLRRRLEVDQEYSRGTREYIRILRMLEHHSVGHLTRAVERCLELGVVGEEAVWHLLLCPRERTPSPLDLKGRGHLAVHIAPPDPGVYALLGPGGEA
jgi:transposase